MSMPTQHVKCGNSPLFSRYERSEIVQDIDSGNVYKITKTSITRLGVG